MGNLLKNNIEKFYGSHLCLSMHVQETFLETLQKKIILFFNLCKDLEIAIESNSFELEDSKSAKICRKSLCCHKTFQTVCNPV